MAEKVAYPETVFCNRTQCQHCLRMKEPQSITVTREVGWTPLFDTQLTHRCDRKNIVVDPNGKCLNFSHHHPDIMRPAQKIARNEPQAAALGLVLPHDPTVEEKVKYLLSQATYKPEELSPGHGEDYHFNLEYWMAKAYLAGRADEKIGVKVDA